MFVKYNLPYRFVCGRLSLLLVDAAIEKCTNYIDFDIIIKIMMIQIQNLMVSPGNDRYF